MQHLQLVLYILLLSTGFGGITISAIFWHRTRARVLLVMIAVISLFSLGLLLFAVLFYLQEILLYPVNVSGPVGLINAGIVVGVYVGIAVAVRLARPDSSRIALAAAATPVALVYAAFAVLAAVYPSLAEWARRHPDLVTLISVGSASLYLGYAGRLLRAYTPSRPQAASPPPGVSFLVVALGWMLLGYALLAVVSTGLLIVLGAKLDATVALNYLLFFGWNVVAILAFIRYLTRPVDLFEAGEIPDETRQRYGISPREAEVIAELSRGLSNQEIADRLNVSFTTVRSHVYNIYKKTGAASRVELLRILSSP